MVCDPYDHAINGQVDFNGAGEFTGPFYGLKVVADVVVTSMVWSPAYETKCYAAADDASPTDWSVWTKLIPGYYPGRFESIVIASGEGALLRV